MTLKNAVFLDRDGVINHAIVKNGKPYPPRTMDELTIPNDVPNGLMQLRQCGYLLVVVTNQPDIARGATTAMFVDAIHEQLARTLPIDEFIVCPHDDAENCECRKPNCGMLISASKTHGIDLKNSFMIGDRWKDISAGKLAGCKTIFIDQGYQEDYKGPLSNVTVHTFADAVQWILNITTERNNQNDQYAYVS